MLTSRASRVRFDLPEPGRCSEEILCGHPPLVLAEPLAVFLTRYVALLVGVPDRTCAASLPRRRRCVLLLSAEQAQSC